MTIRVLCSACGSSGKVRDESYGRRYRCPQCGTLNVVPLQNAVTTTGATATFTHATVGKVGGNLNPACNLNDDPPRVDFVNRHSYPRDYSTRDGVVAIVIGAVFGLVGIALTLGSKEFVFYGAVWAGAATVMEGLYCLSSGVKYSNISSGVRFVAGLIGLLLAIVFGIQFM